MNYEEMFNRLDAGLPQQQSQEVVPNSYEPTYYDQPSMSWEDAFTGFKSRPVLYNVDGFISPYSSNNWGGTSNILQYIDDSSRLPALENKIDPNKVFSSEINALRALAADQQKITKLFEKRLMEGLTEKGKIGLTEEDVEAMSALTAARSAIASINKQQVDIKKNITDIRIKQSQNTNNGNTCSTGSSDKSISAMNIGRSIMDNIFDTPSNSTPVSQMPTTPYQTATVSDAARVLDELIPSVNAYVSHESAEPTTYVVVGESDDDVEFVTYSSSGEIIPDFPNPDARITTIDRDAKTATDEFMVSYPIKTE